jgi:NADP-dependent 3-hydroxy acid dehydrogenase YdfG
VQGTLFRFCLRQGVYGLSRSTTKIKVCVAGGGGFIGSHLARRLLLEGHHVVVADWKCNNVG